jgi:hypothetical protein
VYIGPFNLTEQNPKYLRQGSRVSGVLTQRTLRGRVCPSLPENPESALHSSASRRIISAGVLYLAAGLIFGELAGRATSQSARVGWRWAAWIVSGIAFAAHVALELRAQERMRVTAARAALGAAVRAFGLAAAANIHALRASTAPSLLLVLSLLIWPAMTAGPAFLAGLVIARVASALRRS